MELSMTSIISYILHDIVVTMVLQNDVESTPLVFTQIEVSRISATDNAIIEYTYGGE
jgi:hypothetical protein